MHCFPWEMTKKIGSEPEEMMDNTSCYNYMECFLRINIVTNLLHGEKRRGPLGPMRIGFFVGKVF